ncbi:hypothetical protein ACH5RR_036473 [Cinchona calisaya]|uniref:Late blight resistance protein R1A-like N-terminal domain-containing protein n=1 Tax=Cinchona calisaya TaxID=153742 RepID=A0ABD2Y7X8_9GENT
MVNTFLDSPLKNLYWIEKNCSLDSPLKVQVLTLKQKSRFLRTYLIYRGISSEEAITSTSSSVINNVELEAAFGTATDDLSSACSLPPDFEKIDSAVHYALEKVKLCEPEIRKAYVILWEQPCREVKCPLNPESSADFIDSILENLEDLLGSKSLVSVVKKTVEILKEKLSFLRYFIDITATKSISDQEMGAFLSNVHVFSISAACFSYLCWDSQEDQISGCRMDVKISDLIQKIKPSTSDHMEMYIGLLKAAIQTGSATTKTDEITSLVNFLLDNSMDSLKDQIDAIDEELVYLIAFLIDLPDECTVDLKRISTDIKVVAKEAALFRVNEEQVREMNLVISRLLQKTKLIKAEIILLRLLDSEDTLMFPMKDQMANLHEGLLFLRTFLMDTTDIENEIDDWKVFSVHLEYVVSESLSLISSCGGSEMTEEDMASELNLSIFRLVVKIKLIKAEVMLVELIKFPEVGLIVHMKDEVEILLEGVRFLRMFLMNPPKEEGEELLVAKSEAMANEAASLIFSFHYHVRKEGVASETNHLVPELVEKIELLKADIKDTCLQVPYLPKPEELVVFIRSLLEDMNKLLNQEAKSHAFMKRRIEVLLGDFKFLESFLTETEELYNEHQELKDVWACITDVACETKYIIGDLLVTVRDDDSSWYFMLWISFAIQDIKLIGAKVMNIYDEKRFGVGGAHPHSGVVASARPLTTNDVVVGFEDSKWDIVSNWSPNGKYKLLVV